MKYEVRIYNHETRKVEWVTVDTAGLKRLYWSTKVDIFDIVEMKE